MPVPTAEEAAAAGAPTAVIPPAASAPPGGRGGIVGHGSSASSNPAVAAPVPSERVEVKPKPRTKPAPKPKPVVERTPEQVATGAGRRHAAGLCWVLFGLFWLTIPGFVGFGKIVYAHGVGPLPQGEGWVSIPGYVNDDAAQNAIRMTKADQLDIALYAAPGCPGRALPHIRPSNRRSSAAKQWSERPFRL